MVKSLGFAASKILVQPPIKGRNDDDMDGQAEAAYKKIISRVSRRSFRAPEHGNAMSALPSIPGALLGNDDSLFVTRSQLAPFRMPPALSANLFFDGNNLTSISALR